VVEGVGEMGRCWSKVKDEVNSGNLMCNLVITASITVVYIWKLLRVRRSNQSILKEINSEHSLEGRCWSWSSKTLATWCEEPTHWKRPWCWERLKAGGVGDEENELVGWHHQLNGYEFEQAPEVGDGQGSLAFCSSWGCKKSDTAERLNWSELNNYKGFNYYKRV